MILARLLSATPETDGEHWNLAFAEIQDVWGTDAYSQNPAPYQRNSQLGVPNRPPYPWQPQDLAAGSISELNGVYGFGLVVNTANSPTTLDIYGQIPVNAQPVGFAPQCPFEATVSATGGNFPPGSYVIKISGGVTGPVSQYFINAVIPPYTTAGSITVSGVVWQEAAAAISVYIGTTSQTCSSISAPNWTGSSNDTFGNPTVFTITSAGAGGTGLPDPVFNSFLFQAKSIIHGGVWGSGPTSAGTSGGFATATFAGQTWGTNQWLGYTLSSYAASAVGNEFNWFVSSNTADTLTFTGTVGPVVGSAVVMRAAALSITANTIGDPNFANSFAPAGLIVNAEVGNLLRIVAGTGQGQPPIAILSNTATVFTLAANWTVTPDATSVYIIEAASWTYLQYTSSFSCAGPFTVPPKLGSIPVTNFNFGSLLVEGITLDINGNWSVERYAPIREIFVPATIPSSVTAAVPYAVPVTSVAGIQTATPDASQGENLLVLTPGICSTDSNGNLFVNVAQPINFSPTAGVNTTWQLVTQEDPGGEWLVGTAYVTGNIAWFGVGPLCAFYIAIAGTTGNEPDTSPTFWTRMNALSTNFTDGTYRISFAVASAASPANTQCHVDFKTSSAGVTTPTGSLIDQPI